MTRTGAEYLYDSLVDAGIDLLVGLPGTQTLPLDRVVAERDAIDYVMARNETAIPHVAWGYYEVTGRPAATLTVPGPGDTKAMHGLQNAYDDSVPIVHVAAEIEADERGRGPIHDIDPRTYDPVVKRNCVVDRPFDLPEAVATGIGEALTPPYGPVRLGIPKSVLAGTADLPDADYEPAGTKRDANGSYADAIDLLAAAERPAVLAGGGLRRGTDGPAAVGELADALDATVATTYKGKGVVPADDDRLLGVTGTHFPAGGVRVLDRADVVCAVGTGLDGVTTADWELPLGDKLIHVTLDRDAVDASYETAVPIVDDAARACRRLAAGVRDRSDSGRTWDGARIATAVRREYVDHLERAGLFDETTPLQTPAVLRTVNDALPREAIVTLDIGGFRLWALQLVPAYSPDRFVTAGSWAGMGVGPPSAVGAALARPGTPVVSLVGDGGLLMCCQTLHTAVENDLNVTVVVSNNADYGIISKSSGIDTDGSPFAWDRPDFATVAEGFDCRATRVETRSGLANAVTTAIGRDGPNLIDVRVATDETSVVEAAQYESSVVVD